jgi:hypothetical protein
MKSPFSWRCGVYFPKSKLHSRGVTTVIRTHFAPTTGRYNHLITSQRRIKGMQRGIRVDLELSRFVQTGYVPPQSLPETQHVIQYMRTHKLTPVHAQLPVAYEPLRLATCLDLVCLGEDGSHTIVEIKCGYRYRECSSGTLLTSVIGKNPTVPVVDSPLHQHQLQTLLGQWLFDRSFPQLVRNSNPLLLYTSASGVTAYRGCDFALRLGDIEHVLSETT